MGAPINSFEIIESIRFFAQLVGTDGVNQEVRDLGNHYMLRLMRALEPSIDDSTAKASGITLLK